MAQHGQVLKLRACRPDGKAVWAYRYRVDGGRSKRPQVGGFATRAQAERALRRELERLRPGRQMTLAELVEGYLQVHQAACWTSTRPSAASPIRCGGFRRSGRSSHGTSCEPSPRSSARLLGRW